MTLEINIDEARRRIDDLFGALLTERLARLELQKHKERSDELIGICSRKNAGRATANLTAGALIKRANSARCSASKTQR
jgi:hypothetical protein